MLSRTARRESRPSGPPRPPGPPCRASGSAGASLARLTAALTRSEAAVQGRGRFRLRSRFRLVGAALPLHKPESASETCRAAFGGTLAARELGFGQIWFPSLFASTLVSGDARQWPYSLWCFLPAASMAREASTLSLVTCHAGFSRRGIDPVGETSIVSDTPLGTRHLVVFTTRIRQPETSMVVPNEEPKKPAKPKKPTERRQAASRGRSPSPSPPRRRRSMSSTPTRPESTSIPTCTWSASRPTATPTRSASSAPTPPIFTRSPPG